MFFTTLLGFQDINMLIYQIKVKLKSKGILEKKIFFYCVKVQLIPASLGTLGTKSSLIRVNTTAHTLKRYILKLIGVIFRF